MATDPVCGMFVEEKPDSVQHMADARKYYFCSTQCLNEFSEPERELRKLKKHVAISIALTIPLVILSLPHMFSLQLGGLIPLPMEVSNYVMLALATPIQFWIGWRFYRGMWDELICIASRSYSSIAETAKKQILPGYKDSSPNSSFATSLYRCYYHVFRKASFACHLVVVSIFKLTYPTPTTDVR